MNEQQIHILGAKIDLLDASELSRRLSYWLRGGKGGKHIVTLNPEIALLSEADDDYHKVLNRAALTVADGVGLRLGALLLGLKRPPRITGRQVMQTLCSLAVQERKGVYLVGGAPGIAVKAAAALQRDFRGLRIVGSEEGVPQGVYAVDNLASRQLAERIDASGAEILFVAFGAPKQEYWIAKHLPQMRRVRVAVGVGGLFDYLSGAVRAPSSLWQKLGLEWLYRLLTQPRRWRRIARATLLFLSRILVWRVRITWMFRRNVVACIVDRSHTKVLLVTPWWSQEDRWQFPQGGINRSESPQEAVVREMNEELGSRQFTILRHVPAAHRYTWPRWYQFVKGYKGQDQDLFILEFTGQDQDINLATAAELQSWKWVAAKDMLDELAPPRREVGQIALTYLNQL